MRIPQFKYRSSRPLGQSLFVFPFHPLSEGVPKPEHGTRKGRKYEKLKGAPVRTFGKEYIQHYQKGTHSHGEPKSLHPYADFPHFAALGFVFHRSSSWSSLR